MAKTETQTKRTQEQIDRDNEWWNSPAAFRVDQAEPDGWWQPEVNVMVVGTIRSQFEITDDEGEVRPVIVAQLQAPLQAFLDEVPIPLKVGDHVAIGYRYNLRDLFNFAPGAEFAIKPTKLQNLKKGRTLWIFEVTMKAGSEKFRQRPAKPEPKTTASEIADDDLPL